jgi:hypothetical protein
MATLSETFLAEIERFIARTGIPPTKIGMDTVGDPSYVKRLRMGRSPRANTIDLVRAYMEAKKGVKHRRSPRVRGNGHAVAA